MLRTTSAQLLQESEAQALLRHLTREGLRLHGVGDRFTGRPSRDPVAVGRLFRQDTLGRAGRFAEVRLRLDEPLARRIARFDGVLVEKRLLLAADETRRRCLATLEGVAQVRWQEGPGYDRATVHLLLSARAKDGEATQPLRRADLDRLETAWREESYRVFGLRLREQILERDSPLHARAEDLRERWVEASREAQRVLHARVWDRAPQEDLTRALIGAATAQGQWREAREALEHAAVRSVAPRTGTEVIHFRLEGGRALQPFATTARDAVLEQALDRLGLKRVRAVVYPLAANQRDVGLSLYYERGTMDRDGVLRTVHERLGAELDRLGCRPSSGEVRVTAIAPAHGPQAGERTGDAERVYSRNFHLPAEALTRLQPEAQRAVLRQAIERQWPELEARGLQGSFIVRALSDDARIVRLTVVVPERELEAFQAITRPGGQSGLVREVERALSDRGAELSAGAARMGQRVPAPHAPMMTLRVLEAVATARVAAENPVRAAARAALETLSRVMPAPLRSAHIFMRQAGAMLRREEE
jgi:hypothetical protein